MRNLQASYNPEATRVLASRQVPEPAREIEAGRADVAGRDDAAGRADTDTGNVTVVEDLAELSSLMIEKEVVTKENQDSTPNEPVEPDKFNEAWHHPDPIQRKGWRMAILKEFQDMETRKVWRKMKRSDIPRNRRCVKCKWVFKIKRSGVFRARLVACGYSQISGVDFGEHYSPVVNDVTFRLLLLAMMYFGLTAKVVDVETAFLYGELEEEIFMECPQGMKGVTQDDALSLQACIYGLVQAAR